MIFIATSVLVWEPVAKVEHKQEENLTTFDKYYGREAVKSSSIVAEMPDKQAREQKRELRNKHANLESLEGSKSSGKLLVLSFRWFGRLIKRQTLRECVQQHDRFNSIKRWF